MIYKIDALNELPILEKYDPPHYSFWRDIKGCVPNFLLLPFHLIAGIFLLIFFLSAIIFHTILGLFQRREKEKDFNEKFEYIDAEIVIESLLEEESGWLKLRMNDLAFKKFIGVIEHSLFHPIPPTMLEKTLGAVGPGGDGWHLHLEDHLPEMEYGIIIGTDEAATSIHVICGDNLWASLDLWKKVLNEWKKLCATGEPALIVFDKFQKGWCSEDSQGRLSIEYLPNFCSDQITSE